jgi:aromatic ring hydroxylase-like protein
LNFGYFYADSPVIAYDGEAHPAYSMGRFTSSSVPGCRAPHFWLRDGRSLYDALGPNYTLIRFDPTVRVSGIVEAAARRGVPLVILDVDASDAAALYAHKLVLVRPDQHLAWRGDDDPAAPMDLIDVVRGAHAMAVRNAA